MYTKIEQGIEAYKKELQDYLIYTKQVKESYGIKDTNDFLGKVGNFDYQKTMEWNKKLEGMTLALGLNEEEIKKIDSEFGI